MPDPDEFLTVRFEPRADITAYELAIVCSKTMASLGNIRVKKEDWWTAGKISWIVKRHLVLCDKDMEAFCRDGQH